jgi:hypothetical protein
VAIVVFIHASPADEAAREGTIAALARIAYDTFRAPAKEGRPSPNQLTR